jgi:hypothetical protein
MPRGRPVPELRLAAEERETLQAWARRPKTAQALALRARIILSCAEGTSNAGVSATLRLCPRLSPYPPALLIARFKPPLRRLDDLRPTCRCRLQALLAKPPQTSSPAQMPFNLHTRPPRQRLSF